MARLICGTLPTQGRMGSLKSSLKNSDSTPSLRGEHLAMSEDCTKFCTQPSTGHHVPWAVRTGGWEKEVIPIHTCRKHLRKGKPQRTKRTKKNQHPRNIIMKKKNTLVIMGTVNNDFPAANILQQSKINMRVGLETRKLNPRVNK